jgi:hypothetical protein
MTRRPTALLIAAASLAMATPASAGWSLLPTSAAVAVAKSKLSVTRVGEWNRWSRRPSAKGELWTQNGVNIDNLGFYGGISGGEPLLKERQKKEKPLPKFAADMLLTDIPQLYEQTSRIALATPLFEITKVEPVRFLGHEGVQFAFRFTAEDDDVERLGEARAAIVGGKLYMIDFAAPSLHYFDAQIGDVRRIMDSARL